MSESKILVLELLKSYPHKKRRIAQLRFELEHPALIDGEELIDSLSLGSLAYNNNNSKGGYISDKTMMITLNYPDIAPKMNNETIVQIRHELRVIEEEVDRLEHYLSLLDQQQANILRLYYFEGRTWPELVQEFYISRRSLQNLRDQGVNELASMYQLISDMKANKDEAVR